jgi:hypothetical protein
MSAVAARTCEPALDLRVRSGELWRPAAENGYGQGAPPLGPPCPFPANLAREPRQRKKSVIKRR